jgi:DNA repair protein RadC
MNPLFTEVSTMTITSPIHSFFRALTARSRVTSHPEALQERHLNIPRRIDDPATAARLARELLHSRREDLTLALYMDDRHRFVGHAIVATGWVQAARLSARPFVAGAQASRATGCVIIRYRRYGLPSATKVEQSSFRSITGACWHHGLTVVDHLVVIGSGTFSSDLLEER